MMDPFFSIVTTVLNGERYLEIAINSVINQDLKNFEYIIIDGGSTDRSVEIIKKYSHNIQYWSSEPDKGIYNAMNKGIDHSSGKFVAFLNADDYYLPNVFDKVYRIIQETDSDFYHGNVLIYLNNTSNKIFGRATNDIESLGKGGYIYQPATFVKKEIFLKVGTFNEKYRIVSDYDFFLRAHKAGCTFYHIDDTITALRSGGISDSFKSYLEAYHLLKYYGKSFDYLKNTTCLIQSYYKFIRRKAASKIRNLSVR